MWAPQPFFRQSTILLAAQQEFCTAYLAQALSMFGLRTVGPFSSVAQLHAWVDASPSAAAAIIAADWLRGSAASLPLSLARLNIPYLVVDNAPWRDGASSLQPAFIWPYAAFQVIEALQEAVATSMGLHDIAEPEQHGS